MSVLQLGRGGAEQEERLFFDLRGCGALLLRPVGGFRSYRAAERFDLWRCDAALSYMTQGNTPAKGTVHSRKGPTWAVRN